MERSPMDIDPPPSAPKKPRFTPKAPPRRKVKPPVVEPKNEKDDGDDQNVQDLIRRVNENLGNRGTKVQKKSSVRVAFSHEASSSTTIKTYGKVKQGDDDQSNGSKLKDFAGQSIVVAPSERKKQEHKEPWDYHHTYYPTALPLRRPYSGDPDLLDKEEFGETGARLKYDENNVNPASELGLLEESEEPQMLFLQLPPNLPLNRRTDRLKGIAKGKEVTDSSSIPSWRDSSSNKGCNLEELPSGFMGKMLVYKSGAIKLKLGDNIYDVSPGTPHIFAQDVAAINTESKDCCVLGELEKKAVITPDIDSILDNIIDLS